MGSRAGAGLATCQAYPDWFCPAATTSLSAVNAATTGSPSDSVGYQVGSYLTIMIDQPEVYVSPAVGGPLAKYFDWGLPFFLGRDVFHWLEGSGNGTGAVAY